MDKRTPPMIDMTVDGNFTTPPGAFQPSWPIKIAAVGLIGAVVASALAIAAIFLWLALWLIPIAVVAAAIAWLSLRYQLWKMRRSGRPARGLYRF